MQFNFLETIDSLITALIYLFVSFALFFIGKKVYQLIHKSINVKLTSKPKIEIILLKK